MRARVRAKMEEEGGMDGWMEGEGGRDEEEKMGRKAGREIGFQPRYAI